MTSFGAEPERRDDPLVESCLEEILGGKTPPDLKSDIIRRMSGGKEAHVVPPPFQENTAEVQRPVIQPLTRSTNGRAARSRTGNRVRLQRYAWMMTTGVVVCLVAFAIYSANSKQRDLALSDPVSENLPTVNPASDEPQPETEKPQVVRETPSTPDDSNVATTPSVEDTQPDPQETPVIPEELSDEQLVRLINQQIQQQWELAQIQPTGAIDDVTWCRRVFQRLFGRNMTDDEVRSFERWQPANKRLALMQLVFKHRKYRDEFAAHWGEFWSDRLLARANPRDAKSFQRGLARYLEQQFKESSRHDEWVNSLLTAEGSNILSEDDHNGATNYLLGLRDKHGVLPASEVCRVLMGQRVQCAQCHDDGQAGLTQDQFWELTAFFRQMEVTGYGPGRARLTRLETAESAKFQRPDGNWQQVEPHFFADANADQTAIADDRRAELARMITDSDLFARATVNRVWSHFLGYGFTSPVDDMGHRNPASHPVLLDQLASQFAKADFDTHRLIQWIVLSEPFNRSDVQAINNKSDIPEISFVAFFSRYYHRSSLFLTPHDALVSIGNADSEQLAIMLSESVFGRKQNSFDEDESQEDDDDSGAEQISLEGQLTIGQLRLARSLAKSRMTSEEKLRHVFLAVMARLPSESEMTQATRLYQAAQDNEIQAMENLIWALTRTQEFVNEH